jgi:TrmH family RNA methyltransferase
VPASVPICLPGNEERDRLRVVLVSTRNPLNIGAAARAMSNFGFSRMRVVNPYEPSYREARSATGASDVLANAEEFSGVAGAVADCSLVVGTTAVRRRQLHQPLHPLDHAAGLVRAHLAAGRAALLFGSERVGLSTSALSHCHFLLRIPTCEQNISMNLGQAVAICLYELSRQPQPAPQPAPPTGAESASAASAAVPASSAEMERLTQVLLEALRSSRYLKPNSASVDEDKIRRLMRRLNLSEADATLFLGMLRQILWKFGSM